MNWINLIIALAPLIPQVVHLWDTSAKDGVNKIADVLQKSPVAPVLAQIGSAWFPKLSPALHAAAAALVLAHPNNTSWLQSALNVLKSTGYVNFGTGADLAVDGIYGRKTFAAVEAVQAKLGLPVNGFLADAEYNAIAALLAKV